MPREFRDLDDLTAAVGSHLGYSDWLTIDQARIDAFAQASGDHQWIHVDPVRAAAGPLGSTIAHGYLTLSLVPLLVGGLVDYAGWPTKVNYGSNKVRYPQPVPVGSRVRAGAEVTAVGALAAGIQVTLRVTMEIDGHAKPALVAETITLLVT